MDFILDIILDYWISLYIKVIPVGEGGPDGTGQAPRTPWTAQWYHFKFNLIKLNRFKFSWIGL